MFNMLLVSSLFKHIYLENTLKISSISGRTHLLLPAEGGECYKLLWEKEKKSGNPRGHEMWIQR